MVTSAIKISINAALVAGPRRGRLRPGPGPGSARQAGRIDADDLAAGGHPDGPGRIVDLAAGLAARSADADPAERLAGADADPQHLGVRQVGQQPQRALADVDEGPPGEGVGRVEAAV